VTETTRALADHGVHSQARVVVREHAWTIGIWLAMAGWSVALFALVRQAYLSFDLAHFDLGNMVQAVWSTTQGRPLESTTAAGEQAARLGAHVDPVLLLLAPLWAVVPSPLTLALAQVVAVSLGALPLFWLGRRHLGCERAAGLLALAYLASPWIAWSAYDAIHPKTLAIPLFLFAVWFLDSDRLGAFAVVAVLTAASGELMGITIAGLGIWYALARGRRTAGLFIAAAGTAWSLVALYVVVPAFSGGRESAYFGLYEGVGGSPTGIVRTAVTDPMTIASALFGAHELLYLLLLSAPLLAMFVLSPWLALVASPQFVVNALADTAGPTDPRHHYIAAVIPFLFAAAAIGIGRLGSARVVPVAGAVLVISVAFSVLLGPWPFSVVQVPIRYDVEASPRHEEALRRAAAAVRDDAAVSATNKVGSHLAARRYLYTVPVLRQNTEWVVLDTHDTWVSYRDYPYLAERPRSELLAFRDRLAESGKWTTVVDADGVYVFRRAASP